jgi:hypothetical protein
MPLKLVCGLGFVFRLYGCNIFDCCLVDTIVNTNSLEVEEACNWQGGKPRLLDQSASSAKLDDPESIQDDDKASEVAKNLIAPQRLPANYSRTAVVFLGDYVDRGKNSLEVVLLLLLYRLCYPGCVFLTRGVI